MNYKAIFISTQKGLNLSKHFYCYIGDRIECSNMSHDQWRAFSEFILHVPLLDNNIWCTGPEIYWRGFLFNRRAASSRAGYSLASVLRICSGFIFSFLFFWSFNRCNAESVRLLTRWLVFYHMLRVVFRFQSSQNGRLCFLFSVFTGYMLSFVKCDIQFPRKCQRDHL